ncbi:hypothetical protein WJX73_008095 [Symbiochloris irregularis]|uniref:Uncharacterized protein n=1 Tax=Symbiochloris irregularis TaxID=706552 RepID=A0AAW1NXM7_9CHLO
MESTPPEQFNLFTAALQSALATHLLPKLGARALESLACGCRSGRELVAQADLSTLQAIAARVLPPRHPASKSAQVCDIRTALVDFGLHQASVRRGQLECRHNIPRVIGFPKFAPNGFDFAVLVEEQPNADEGLSSGAQPGPANAWSFLGNTGGSCLMTYLEDDNAGDDYKKGTSYTVPPASARDGRNEWVWSR